MGTINEEEFEQLEDMLDQLSPGDKYKQVVRSAKELEYWYRRGFEGHDAPSVCDSLRYLNWELGYGDRKASQDA